MSGLMLGVVVVSVSVLSALAALLVMGALRLQVEGRRDADLFATAEENTVFLFDDEDLVDATDAARALLRDCPGAGSDLARLLAHLAPQFPGVAAALGRLAEDGRIDMVSMRPPVMHLRGEWRGGLARLALVAPEAEGARLAVDRLAHSALEAERATLRAVVEALPLPVWRTAAPEGAASDGDDGDDEDDGEAVIWANRAYLDLAGAMHPGRDTLTWPLPALFAGAAPSARLRADLHGAGVAWFDHVVRDADDGGTLHFALPADAAHKAETALRKFVRTLTRTFAHLSTGLAIFDEGRRLALFNPALTDLTTLPADFLAARPTLNDFFDRLREARMMPEPRDYRSWRRQVADLEKAAASGQFQETWSLPSGLTYRVTGRPHADGAVAFLIDDVSAEIALARRFRADLDTGQAVIDRLDAAVAVFSVAGVLVMANAAYARLWGVDPASALGEVTAEAAVGHWFAAIRAEALWHRARAFLAAGSEAEEFSARVPRPGDGGATIECRFRRLRGGAAMVEFHEFPEVARAKAPDADAPAPSVLVPAGGRPAVPGGATAAVTPAATGEMAVHADAIPLDGGRAAPSDAAGRTPAPAAAPIAAGDAGAASTDRGIATPADVRSRARTAPAASLAPADDTGTAPAASAAPEPEGDAGDWPAGRGTPASADAAPVAIAASASESDARRAPRAAPGR